MPRTKDEQKAYLDGFEECAKCIKKYLSDEGKKILECQIYECQLMTVKIIVENEDKNEMTRFSNFTDEELDAMNKILAEKEE